VLHVILGDRAVRGGFLRQPLIVRDTLADRLSAKLTPRMSGARCSRVNGVRPVSAGERGPRREPNTTTGGPCWDCRGAIDRSRERPDAGGCSRHRPGRTDGRGRDDGREVMDEQNLADRGPPHESKPVPTSTALFRPCESARLLVSFPLAEAPR